MFYRKLRSRENNSSSKRSKDVKSPSEFSLPELDGSKTDTRKTFLYVLVLFITVVSMPVAIEEINFIFLTNIHQSMKTMQICYRHIEDVLEEV